MFELLLEFHQNLYINIKLESLKNVDIVIGYSDSHKYQNWNKYKNKGKIS